MLIPSARAWNLASHIAMQQLIPLRHTSNSASPRPSCAFEDGVVGLAQHLVEAHVFTSSLILTGR